MSTSKTTRENKPKDDNELSEELKQNNKAANAGEDHDDEKFPGYPHYPPQEDIMRAASENRVDLDVENLSKRGTEVNVDLNQVVKGGVTVLAHLRTPIKKVKSGD